MSKFDWSDILLIIDIIGFLVMTIVAGVSQNYPLMLLSAAFTIFYIRFFMRDFE